MTAPRLHEVVARVVAWHNRHPLARRIDASQVHSIGEVQLPFVSRQAMAGAAAPAAAAPVAQTPDSERPPALSSLGAALAQRSARLHPPVDAASAQPAGADAPPDPEPAQPMAAADHPAPTAAATEDAPPGPLLSEDDDDEAALLIPLLDGDAAAEPAAADTSVDARPTAPAGDGDAAADAGTDAAPAPAAGLAHDAVEAVADGGAPEDAAPHAPDAVHPPPHGAVPASALARAVERRAAARAPLGAGADAVAHARAPDDAEAAHGDHATDADHAAHAVHAAAPPATVAGVQAGAPPAGRWQRLRAALRRWLTGRQPGLPPLRAAFNQDFAWPLKPARIARWAERHGQWQPLAPDDWPRRTIDTHRARTATLRQQGHVHDVPLHVLTAAIGVGDRRIRVLVGADGSVLGPRAWDARRTGSVAVLVAGGLVALGWHLRPLHGPGPAQDAAVLASLAASAAAPASAADVAAAPASAASAADEGQAAEAGHAASGPADGASAAGHATALASAASAAAPDDAASAPQADIRPALSPEDRYAARVESARLRGEPPPPPPTLVEAGGPVYALVGPSSPQRDHAASSLALMKAAAPKLDGAAPAHGELVQSQGQWRAAWWPFASLVDAERARVLLAGKGLKAEVVEF